MFELLVFLNVSLLLPEVSRTLLCFLTYALYYLSIQVIALRKSQKTFETKNSIHSILTRIYSIIYISCVQNQTHSWIWCLQNAQLYEHRIFILESETTKLRRLINLLWLIKPSANGSLSPSSRSKPSNELTTTPN